MKMLKALNIIGIFKNDEVWFPTYYAYNTMWNFSDASSQLALVGLDLKKNCSLFWSLAEVKKKYNIQIFAFFFLLVCMFPTDSKSNGPIIMKFGI